MPVYCDKDDALQGDKIAVSARLIDEIAVMKRTGKHRGQFTTLRDNAYCVIEMPFRWVLEKDESKRAKEK